MCSRRVAFVTHPARCDGWDGRDLSVGSFMVETRFDQMFDIEHLIDYIRTPERSLDRAKGRQMTLSTAQRGFGTEAIGPPTGVRRARATEVRPHGGAPGGDAHRRPGPAHPAGVPLRYRGTGVRMSGAAHRRRPITPATTVLLALLAAGITVWLGLVAQLGGAGEVTAPVPGQLAVVQVQAGENLAQVAARVAPDAPTGQVVDRIRELNELDSAAVDAGQTLIAPIG